MSHSYSMATSAGNNLPGHILPSLESVPAAGPSQLRPPCNLYDVFKA